MKNDLRSNEAALKYFLLGATGVGVMLYGLSLLYGLGGSLDLFEIGRKLTPQAASFSLLAGMLILIGFGFKATLVPFHMWAPDTYKGAPTTVTAFLSVVPKGAALGVLWRLFSTALQTGENQWLTLLALLSALTMTVGNLLALRQTHLKRLLAYSSIAQAGFLLMALASGDPSDSGRIPLGVSAFLFYLMAYLVMNLGAFLFVARAESLVGSDEIAAYEGLARLSPLRSLAMALFLLSLAGIPPWWDS